MSYTLKYINKKSDCMIFENFADSGLDIVFQFDYVKMENYIDIVYHNSELGVMGIREVGYIWKDTDDSIDKYLRMLHDAETFCKGYAKCKTDVEEEKRYN